MKFILKPKSRRLEVHLEGGLGNQLFQYFAGLYVASELDRHLILLGQKIAYKHTFGLFDIRSFKIEALVKNKKSRFISKLIHIYNYVKSRTFSQQDRFLVLDESTQVTIGSFAETSNLISGYKFRNSNRMQMRGYFQDFSFYNYVNNVNTKLILAKPSERFKILMEDCLETKPIGVHVRLGDFLDVENVHAIGTLSPDYYNIAFSILKERGIDGPIWVFSNDKLGAINLFDQIPSASELKFIDSGPDVDPAEDLLLMSYCSALIAANSTYSFWAGAFGGSKMQVIYPEEFTRANIYQVSGIPTHWTSLQSLWN